MTYVPAGGRYDRMTYDRSGRSGLLLPAISPGLWLRDRRATSTLIGASSVEQLETNVRALDRLDFGADELSGIDRHATDSGINLWAGSSAE